MYRNSRVWDDGFYRHDSCVIDHQWTAILELHFNLIKILVIFTVQANRNLCIFMGSSGAFHMSR